MAITERFGYINFDILLQSISNAHSFALLSSSLGNSANRPYFVEKYSVFGKEFPTITSWLSILNFRIYRSTRGLKFHQSVSFSYKFLKQFRWWPRDSPPSDAIEGLLQMMNMMNVFQPVHSVE